MRNKGFTPFSSLNIGMYYHRIWGYGGVEKVTQELAKLYYDNGYINIDIIYLEDNIDLKTVNLIKEYANVIQVKEAQEKMYDVLIYQGCYQLVDLQAKKKIQLIHNVFNSTNCALIPYIRKCDLYTVVGSKECYGKALEYMNVPMSNMLNYINVDEVKQKALEKIDIQKKCLTFVTVSRLAKEKGFNRVIRMLEELERNDIWYQWIIIGSIINIDITPITDKYEYVSFIGEIENPYPYIKMADYVVQLSDYEAQCLVLYEALILNTPVIATNFGSAVETLNDRNGIVLEMDMSNLDIDKIVNSTYNFEYEYPDNKQEWLDLLK